MMTKVDQLISGIMRNDRAILAKCITILESTLPYHRQMSKELMDLLTSNYSKHEHITSFRIGICGPPGAGKSSLIECLGKKIIQDNISNDIRVAVIPIDPSSSLSGGSILGDKVRMPFLSNSPFAYIRASPNKCQTGGLTESTVEVMQVCEYAGYDRVFIESVGIGQSEIDISKAVDMVILVISPGAGDDIQAMKKGIMEVVDMIIVNKADGELKQSAKEAVHNYTQALHLKHQNHKSKVSVKSLSTVSMEGVVGVLDEIEAFRLNSLSNNSLKNKRLKQALFWTWNAYQKRLLEDATSQPDVVEAAATVESEFSMGRLSIRSATERLLSAYKNKL